MINENSIDIIYIKS